MTHKTQALPVGVQKIRFSFRHHMLPPILGIAASMAVYGALNFSFLQAQAQYYLNQLQASLPAPAVAPVPTAPTPQTSELIIPAIKVKAPVIYEPSTDNTTIGYALRDGVVHYGTTALPGEKGNVVVFGHSSGLAWAPGDYKFVFTLLDKLQNGQHITLHHEGVRYIYMVTGQKIIAPTDIKALDSDGEQSQLMLITCTPVGSSEKRLIVYARQISPDPVQNKPFQSRNVTGNSLPGN